MLYEVGVDGVVITQQARRGMNRPGLLRETLGRVPWSKSYDTRVSLISDRWTIISISADRMDANVLTFHGLSVDCFRPRGLINVI